MPDLLIVLLIVLLTDATKLQYNPVMDRSANIIDDLRSAGYRLTPARRVLVSILSDASSPLGVPELIELMADSGASVNKTTVYRELEFLRQREFVTEVLVGDGLRRFELMPEGHHHHHLVCKECNKVECVEVERCVGEEVSQIEKISDFKITEHSLKFFGLCGKCRA